jgi:hypothetical protein
MIILALALLLQVQEPDIVGPPRPPLYRWKDTAGQTRITTTLPPQNAAQIETFVYQVEEVELKPHISPPTAEELRAQLESVMGEETIKYWQSVNRSLKETRQSGDSDGYVRTIESALSQTLWGNGLWVLPIVPFVIMAICLLLAWWVCLGFSRRVKTLVWAGFVLLGTCMSHLGLQGALYHRQAKRMDFMLSVFPHYLGGDIQLEADGLKALQNHVEPLSKAAKPMSPAWAFPVEVYRTQRTLHGIIQDLYLVTPARDDLMGISRYGSFGEGTTTLP